MVKIGQRVPFRPAYMLSLSLQMIMILTLPMLAFWSPKEAGWRGVWGGTYAWRVRFKLWVSRGFRGLVFASMLQYACLYGWYWPKQSEGSDDPWICWKTPIFQAHGENITPSNWGFTCAILCCAVSWPSCDSQDCSCYQVSCASDCRSKWSKLEVWNGRNKQPKPTAYTFGTQCDRN